MKKIYLFFLLAFVLCGCSRITEEQYNAKVEEAENNKKEYETLLAEYQNYKEETDSKISSLSGEVDSLKTKYDNLKVAANSKDKTIEDLSAKINENLDTINDLFAENDMVATEINSGNQKWLILCNKGYTILDMVAGNQIIDTENVTIKIKALQHQSWFDYDYVLLHITMDEFGTIGTVEINMDTWEVRSGSWEIE